MTTTEICQKLIDAGHSIDPIRIQLYRELERLDALDSLPYPSKGLAGNLGGVELGVLSTDIQHHGRALIDAGLAYAADPAWDFSDPLWLTLTKKEQ